MYPLIEMEIRPERRQIRTPSRTIRGNDASVQDTDGGTAARRAPNISAEGILSAEPQSKHCYENVHTSNPIKVQYSSIPPCVHPLLRHRGITMLRDRQR